MLTERRYEKVDKRSQNKSNKINEGKNWKKIRDWKRNSGEGMCSKEIDQSPSPVSTARYSGIF